MEKRKLGLVVNGTHPTTIPAIPWPGVPQGSALGPTPFILFINGITKVTSSQLRLFADDTVLYNAIKSPQDHQVLQEVLHYLTKWASDWQMNFNVSKCPLFRATNKHKPSDFVFSVHSEELSKVS